ncbi:hypothetical protein Ancab_014635 [Ancistrocladus abbreviatus]
MGHRHLFSSSQIFEFENDQHWNPMQVEDPYLNLARSAAPENGSFFHPGDKMSIDRIPYVCHWNPAARLNGHSSSSNVTGPHNQSNASGPRDSLHPLPTGNIFMVPENNVQHASSSNYVVENNFFDLAMSSGRGPYKRKSPGIPSITEGGSTSGYYCAGSSSDVSSSSELQREMLNVDAQHSHWESMTLTPTYRVNHLSTGGESSLRNVRSRPTFDSESDIFRTHQSGNYLHHTNSARQPLDHSNSGVHPSQTLTVPLPEWNRPVPTAPHARTITPDASGVNHEGNHFFNGNSVTNTSVQMGGYHQDLISSRNPGVPQSSAATLTQTARGVRSSYVHRSNPTSRVSAGNLIGHPAPPDESLQLLADSYSSSHPRSFGSAGWRNSERSGRSRLSAERYRSLSVHAVGHDQLTPEGLMIVDRSSLYGSRTLFDQYRDMRLDVDNMGYEELLALGESIGSVNTGLSEDLLSKCLTEMIYCSSDQMQEEDRCVICLEEYENMDEVALLKACRHDYHVACIKKWLSMKNSCPICKVSALPDNMKDK